MTPLGTSRWLVPLVALTLVIACGPPAMTQAPGAPPSQPAKPVAPPAAEAPKPAAQPAAPAKAAAPTPRQLTLGTSAATSGYYAFTVGVARLIQSKLPAISVTVSEGGGTSLNAKRIAEDKIDFSLAGYGALYAIYAGLDPAWKDNPLKDARALWVADPGAHVWYVREDSGITNIEQVHGKDFSPGGRGSATEVFTRLLVFPALGIEPRWYLGGYDDAVGAMRDRRIVGMGKATAIKRPDALIQDAMATMKIRILGFTPQQVQRVQAKYPFMKPADIPPGTYKAEWNEKPITTWQDGVGIFARATFPEDLAYAFTKYAVEDNRPGGGGIVAAAFPAIKEFDMAEVTLSLAPIPLHAGAYRYFQEIGAKVPDHLKPPEVR